MKRELIVTRDDKQMQQEHHEAEAYHEATANQTNTPDESVIFATVEFCG